MGLIKWRAACNTSKRDKPVSLLGSFSNKNQNLKAFVAEKPDANDQVNEETKQTSSGSYEAYCNLVLLPT